MDKDFEPWHTIKSTLNRDKKRPFFHERDVWFASLGLNVGFEQDGKGSKFLRPIVIIKKFNNDICWCLPLTRSKKEGVYYFTFKNKTTESTIILSQIRLIDSKRLYYKTETISHNIFNDIKQKLRRFLA